MENFSTEFTDILFISRFSNGNAKLYAQDDFSWLWKTYEHRNSMIKLKRPPNETKKSELLLGGLQIVDE